MAVTKKKAKKKVVREYAFLNPTYGDLTGPFSKAELVRELTDISFDYGNDQSALKSTKVFKLAKVKATITPASITIA